MARRPGRQSLGADLSMGPVTGPPRVTVEASLTVHLTLGVGLGASGPKRGRDSAKVIYTPSFSSLVGLPLGWGSICVIGEAMEKLPPTFKEGQERSWAGTRLPAMQAAALGKGAEASWKSSGSPCWGGRDMQGPGFCGAPFWVHVSSGFPAVCSALSGGPGVGLGARRAGREKQGVHLFVRMWTFDQCL